MAAGIADLNDPALCVARVHQGNTSRKVIVGTCWQPIPVAEIELRSGSALAHFHAEASPAYHRGTEAVSGPLPLVSCIMPTAGRPAFVRLALRCFQQQDYPRRELIIVHDPGDDLSGLIEGIPEVRLIRAPARLAIGAKRNLACQAARGTIIAHWDDDDWHGPERLSHQVAPLLQGLADLSGVENRYLLELVSGQFWSVTPALHQRMFVGDVHGGTLVFQKSIYDQGLRYPEVNLAEDAGLLRLAIQRGKRLSRLSNPGLFVYVRHGSNAWRFVPGRFLDSAGWQKAEGPTAFLPWLPDYQACLGVGSTHLGSHNP
jgi:glycosyltransferase involved in cell wall biosynthesis